jgi:HAMP domain-containing protein
MWKVSPHIIFAYPFIADNFR